MAWGIAQRVLLLVFTVSLSACSPTRAADECQRGVEKGVIDDDSIADVDSCALLQNRFDQKADDVAVRVQPVVGKLGESDVDVNDMEAVADLNMLALGNETCQHSGITRQEWMNVFSGLDRDGDGVLSTSELRSAEEAPPTGRRNLTKIDHNLTMPQIRAGLALMASWFPEQAVVLVTHEALITALAYRGIRPPPDTAVPSDPLNGLVVRPKRDYSMLAVASQTTRSAECIESVFEMVMGVLGLLFGLIGLELPSGGFVFDIVQTNHKLVDMLIDFARGASAADDPFEAAGVVKDVFMILHEEGIFSQVVGEALSQLSWWDYTLMSVQVAATVAAWAGTGGAAFVAQIALGVFDAVSIFEGARATACPAWRGPMVGRQCAR